MRSALSRVRSSTSISPELASNQKIFCRTTQRLWMPHAPLRKRARLEQARQQLRQSTKVDFGKILSFDLRKKQQIMAAIRDHAARTKQMTIAARNQKIEDERDLDSFLEACLRLGLIDSEGNLKK